MPSHDAGILLDARGLYRSFGRTRILRGVDLTLRRGEVLAVLGPNGAGKTTLLRLLAGLMRPTAGEIRLLGERVSGRSDPRRSVVGFVSHQSLLYDDLTLEENLAFAARLHGVERPREAAARALAAAGLADRRTELPRRLSRGLLQRAAIARSLIHSPQVLLLDEPFTGLDAAAADRFRNTVSDALPSGLAAVVVTHYPGEIWDLATHVGVLIEGRWAVYQTRSGDLDALEDRYRQLTRA
ncbi:MAG TPA: heme ABC exporter ATP-binding protein CcmA [Gemmatimonadales bacterium]|nr:heme ABC exporter ATP-binding protein CcmA [Gemmatimonadales bacterium]